MVRIRWTHRKLAPGLLALMVALASGQAFAAKVEAKKDGVEVYKEATNKSQVVAKLKKGESVESLERKGMFWSVKLEDGTEGYVSVMAVKHQPDADPSLSKAIRSVVKQGRDTDEVADARSRSAVMGVRGAFEDEDSEFAGNVKPNLRAVFFMEDLVVSQDKLEKLGEQVFAEIEAKARRRSD